MADPFTAFIEQLTSLGFFSFLLPWLFTFAVVYGLLSRVKLFGDNNNRISAMIGVIAAFFVTPYAGPALASYFTTIFGGSAMILAGILAVVLFAAMIGIEATGERGLGSRRFGLPIVVIIGIILFFFALGGELGEMTIGSDTLISIAFLVVLILAIWFIVKGGEGQPSAATQPQGRPPG